MSDDREGCGEPVLSAIVVSYNTRELTLECLRQLVRSTADAGVPTEVFVVDNGSGDLTAGAVRDALPEVRVIENAENIGFGAANNQAIRLARGQLLLLLNSDAFIDGKSVTRLIAYLRSNIRVGVVGPKLLNRDGTLQESAWPFPSPTRCWVEALGASPLFNWQWSLRDWRRWSYDRDAAVPWLVGACLVVRREVIERVGGFDETFFLYGEETEWEHRVQAHGWEVHFVHLATATHLGGASGMSNRTRTRSLFFDGLDRYLKKHYGVRGLLVARLAMVVGGIIRLPVFIVARLIAKGRAERDERLAKHAWLLRRHLTDWRCLGNRWAR